ncbi:MAG: ankyrin repeat domain-containing protein [Desulfobacterales bacterium]|nr:ankyrin repeat domain-containing protein [Desulfobacterales bacterium]
MKSLWKKFSQKAKQHERPKNKFMSIIESDDFDQIESTRDIVQTDDIPLLIDTYWKLKKWDHKWAVVEILQDQHHPDMKPMMIDFLRVPSEPFNDSYELAQAIALSFVDEKYDRFMKYYNDRDLLHKDVSIVLKENNLKKDVSSEPVREEKPVQENKTEKIPNQQLMDGAVTGDIKEVKEAINRGANINVTFGSGDYFGCSALLMSLMRLHYNVSEYIIDNGADINQIRYDQHKPEDKNGQTALWWVANRGHIELAQKLISLGADINKPDSHGSTPVKAAASSGHIEVLKLFVENGGDINASIYDGRTGFDLAVSNGHFDTVQYLLSVGMDPNHTKSSGYTSLMTAVEENHYDIVELLLQNKADVNASFDGGENNMSLKGWTPLVFSVKRGLIKMTKLLIKHGADINVTTPQVVNYKGELIPEKNILEYIKGKNAEGLTKLLKF